MKIKRVTWGLACIFVSFLPLGVSALDPGSGKTAYTLKTAVEGDRRLFIGVGGRIDGLVNPILSVKAWDVVEITLVNDDGLNHHIAVPDFFIMSKEVMEKGTKTVVTFVPFKTGGFIYYCILDNHRELGMEGQMIVSAK